MAINVIEVPVKPDHRVSFAVVCRPASGATIEEMQDKLSLDNVATFLPDERTLARVIAKLKDMGFTVYDEDPSPVVCASGTVEQFEALFNTKLVRYKQESDPPRPGDPHEFCRIDPQAKPPDLRMLGGDAIQAVPAEPPKPASAIPPPDVNFHLRHAVDVALVTKAARVHRQRVPLTGQLATGSGVTVAMLDDGFFPHPYYKRNGYNIVPVAAADATGPATTDPTGHGTAHAVNIFTCAPDARVLGVKMGPNSILSFNRARALFAKVIVCSWGWDLAGMSSLPSMHFPLRFVLLSLLSQGITLVFSAGNDTDISFPAIMREVIAVGGVEVANSEALSVWPRTSSYVSVIYPGRRVPDLCGVSSNMRLPTSPASGMVSLWELTEGTSAAAPQVAGVIALLLQRNPWLTPADVKVALCASATDITVGASSSGTPAGPGVDLATGSGLVDALQAWSSV